MWIHPLPFKGDDPLDSLWALECRNPGLNITIACVIIAITYAVIVITYITIAITTYIVIAIACVIIAITYAVIAITYADIAITYAIIAITTYAIIAIACVIIAIDWLSAGVVALCHLIITVGCNRLRSMIPIPPPVNDYCYVLLFSIILFSNL